MAAGLVAWGLELDPERNAATAPARISADASRPVYVIPTDEETAIARAVNGLLAEEE